MSGVDRISSLPDEIILHILSFLPTTKLRAQTSVLSKRWREIWTHLPSLHLSVNKSGAAAAIAGSQFFNAVACCILSFKPHSIHQLSADLWFPTSSPRSRRSLRQGLCHLNPVRRPPIRPQAPNPRPQQIHFRNSSPIPDSLYCCTSLVDLQINSGAFPAVPVNFNGFRALKSLSLNNVTIDTDELGYLLGCCGRLETVRIIGCDGFTHLVVGLINLPKLRDLTVYFCEDLFEASVEAHLNSIVYEGDLQCLEFYISRVLYEAALRQEIAMDLDTQAHFMSILFSVENASILTANDWFYQFVISEPGVLYNLKDLTLYIDEELTEFMLKVLITNIEECPKLETLHIDLIYVPRDSLTLSGSPPQLQYNDALIKFVEENDEQDWCDLPELMPKCFLLQLKTVVLRNFLGSTNEMLLVKFLLGNNVALEKFYVFDFLERDEEELKELFAPFPRASSQVELKLSLSENWRFNLSTRHSWLFS